MLALCSKDPLCALPLWTLAVLLGGGLGCGLTEPPPDAKPRVQGGQEAVRDAVALAMENKDRCLEVGRGGAERLEEETLEDPRNPGSPSPERSFRHYVEVEAAPELAAAAERTKTIGNLLPRVKKEASPELAQAVEELARAQRVVCLRAEERRATAAAYEDQIAAALYDYENAFAAVELRFTITSGDQALAAARYRSAVQEAADRVRRTVERAETWEREEEPVPAALPQRPPEELAREQREWEERQRLVAEQEATHQAALEEWRRERAKREETVPGQKVGRGPSISVESMRAWHAVYAPRAEPVRAALARFLPVVRRTDVNPEEICRSLLDSTTALLDDKAALDAPDPKVGSALETAYQKLQASARACLASRRLEANYRLRDGETSLGRAASLLEPYSLRP